MKKQLPKGVRPLDFFDLPPEIRNAIYELLLCRHEHLRIFSSMINRDETDDILVAMSGGQMPRVPPASILSANRQTNSEATQIMYGGNTFFMGMMEVPIFVSSINSSTKHLHHITLQATYKPQYLSDALKSLSVCGNLETMTLETTGMPEIDITIDNTEKLAYLLLPWATKSNNAREGSHKPGSLQVLRIREGTAMPHRPQQPVDATKLEEEVKAYLGKLLGGRKRLRSR